MYYLTEEDYAIAKSNGISRNLAYYRYYVLKQDLERVLTEAIGESRRRTPNAILWEEWKHVAEENGVTKVNFFNRLNAKRRVKWTPEEAASTPVTDKRFRRKAKITPAHYELAEKNGIAKSTLQNRVYNLHWNPYRAATEEVNSILNWRAQ